jgi:8-oxo-dGTP pyrophosphatase MutT (NUDIX family)
MHVFPGGAVHAGDRAAVPWIGPGADAWAVRWGCGRELAAALVVAAVRETFEETGILLAGADARSVVGAVDGDDWQAARRDLEAGELKLGQFLRDRDLALRADLLAAWAHWITPEFEPRRFDTRFFVAALPAGQVDVRHGTEADSSFWIEPAAAVRAAETGDIAMMVPTLFNLRDLCRTDLAAVLSGAAERPITTVQPRLTVVDGQRVLTSDLDAAGA